MVDSSAGFSALGRSRRVGEADGDLAPDSGSQCIHQKIPSSVVARIELTITYSTPSMPSKIKILKGMTVSVMTTVIALGSAEVLLRWNGYAETAAVYYDADVGLRYFPNQSRRMIRGGRDLGSVTTNEWGFRSPAFKLKKAPDTLRIACLGDSFTLGWGVSNEETWPSLLQDKCDKRYGAGRVEVLNLGLPDFNTVNELRLYRSFASSLDSDLVILGYVENDLAPETLGPVSKVAVFDQWIGSSAVMRAVRIHLYHKIGVYQYAHNAQNTGRRELFNKNKLVIQNQPKHEVARPYWNASMAALKELATAIHEDQHELLLMVFPLRSQVPSSGEFKTEESGILPPYQRRLGLSAKALRVPMLDLREEYARFGADLYADIDNFHPGPAGMKIAAKEIDKLLASSDLLPKR